MFEKLFGNGESLAALAQSLKEYIPKGTNKSFDIDGVAFKVTNDNGKVDISIKDLKLEELKTAGKEFKDRLNKLDNDIYIEVLKAAKDTISIDEFDKLCEKDALDSIEFAIFCSLAETISNAAIKILKEKIKHYQELLELF